jgi:hypothetical protein
MQDDLARAAVDTGLLEPGRQHLRMAFGLACADRVRHLLEEPRAIACLTVLRDFVAGLADEPALQEASREITRIANQHRGSDSIDGSAHAAVSATFAAANALAGRPIEAASYAAYAAVYAYGGYAVNDPSSFEPEIEWQLGQLRRLAAGPAAPPGGERS